MPVKSLLRLPVEEHLPRGMGRLKIFENPTKAGFSPDVSQENQQRYNYGLHCPSTSVNHKVATVAISTASYDVTSYPSCTIYHMII